MHGHIDIDMPSKMALPKEEAYGRYGASFSHH